MLAMAAGTASATTEKKSPTAATAASKADNYSADVTGTTSDGRDVTGKFTPRKLQVVNKKLVAKGTLAGTITGGDKAPRKFHRAVSMPVQVDDTVASTGVGGGRMGRRD